MFDFVKKWFAGRASKDDRLMPESLAVVLCDDEGLRVAKPNSKLEAVKWSELAAVIVETNDQGPIATDVHWILMGREGKSGCVVPQGATGEQEMLVALQKLPGFDNDALISAMGCVENKTFVLWRAAPP